MQRSADLKSAALDEGIGSGLGAMGRIANPRSVASAAVRFHLRAVSRRFERWSERDLPLPR